VRRYIECALRVKWRLSIAGLLVAASAFAFLYMNKQGYSSSATVWVDRPIYFSAPSTWNQYLSPADNQANILSELIRTRQFSLAVAHGAQVAMPTDAAQGAVIADIQQNLRIDTLGAHLVSITYTNKKPTYATAIISQTIQLFVQQVNGNRTTEAQSALTLYQQQRAATQQQMETSRQALTAYLQNNPNSGALGSAPNPVLTDLQQQFESDRSRYTDIVAKIDSISADSGAASLASHDFFRLIDPPRDPDLTPFLSKATYINAALAAGMALLVVVALTLISTWTDPALYTLHDLQRMVVVAADGAAPDVLVAAVPYLPVLARTSKARGPQRKGRPQTARVGATAAATITAEPPSDRATRAANSLSEG